MALLGFVHTVSRARAWTPPPPSSLLRVLGGLLEVGIKDEIKGGRMPEHR